MIKGLEKLLLAKGIKPTAMRLIVLEFLRSQRSAISLTEMEAQLDHSDRATIFRTLKTFEEKGMIHAIDDGTGKTKYALCQDECDTLHHHDLHIHFYCNSCEETTCHPGIAIPEIHLPEGYAMQEINLVVKGTCMKCTA